MENRGFKRKLSAILSADVAGYSRLMGEDDEATVTTLTGHREMMSSIILQHYGRVVDSPGDNLLAAFSSVTQAVDCAVEIQREMAERNEELPAERKMEYRIGVNLGEVIEEADRIYGDGVNIAARLEALAEPGGICISGFVYNQVKNRLKLEYEYLGEQSVKNIKEAVPVYRVLSVPGAAAHRVIQAKKKASSSHDKPSIAVLPFVNMSNNPEQEYFSDGMTEEIICALARLEGLKVISRTSAFYYKGKDVKLHQVGEDLKVDHVLEGSVRKAGNKIRVSAQLIKVADDTHLWSESYNRELIDVFDIQEEISQSIVQNLKVKFIDMQTDFLVKDYTRNTEVYELFLKGKYFEQKGGLSYEKAIGYIEKAIQADPGLAKAYSKLAMMHYHNSISLSLPSKEMWPQIKTLTLKALAIDEMDADAHASLGLIKSLYEYDWKGAEINFKRAIELNPANSDAHFHYARFLAGLGRIDEAIEKIKEAIEHDPFSVFLHAMLGMIFYMGHHFEKAITQSHKALELDSNNHLARVALAMSHAAKGMNDEGIKILQPVINIPIIPAFIAILCGKGGKREEAQKILKDLLERSRHGYFSPLMIAAIYGSLGKKDKGFEWLEKAYEEYDTANCWIKVEPIIFDELRSDNSWGNLMEKMGLAD